MRHCVLLGRRFGLGRRKGACRSNPESTRKYLRLNVKKGHPRRKGIVAIRQSMMPMPWLKWNCSNHSWAFVESPDSRWRIVYWASWAAKARCSRLLRAPSKISIYTKIGIPRTCDSMRANHALARSSPRKISMRTSVSNSASAARGMSVH